MSHHPRRILTSGASRKRKEREAFYGFKPSAQATSVISVEPKSSNRLLAGYMAYEFLSKGTLFGEKFDPARAEAVPLSSGSKPGGAEPSLKKEHQSYTDVASILKSDGAHIPGIVNPTQLARWIQM